MYLHSTKTRITTAILVSGLAIAGSLPAQELTSFDAWTDEQKADFLRTADVVETDELSVGITQPLRATLRQGDVVHDAHIQRVNEQAPVKQTPNRREFNFRDYWGFNVAAYCLDRLLGINMLPVAVERKYQGTPAAFAWWVDDVQMMEKERWQRSVEPPDQEAWNRQMLTARVFNELAHNTDPNLGNVLIDSSWRIWLVDYTRAFRIQTKLLRPEGLTRIDRDLLERLRTFRQRDRKGCDGRVSQ